MLGIIIPISQAKNVRLSEVRKHVEGYKVRSDSCT
jgi:hypothetical protein